jgi:hypothetical protein
MAGYREITVAGGESRPRRPAAKERRAAPTARSGWRAILARGISYGLAEGAVLCREKPGSVFGAVVAVGAAGFICMNALGHQTGRHPAPILPKVAAKTPAKVAAAAPPKALPEPAPAAKEAPRDVSAEPVKPAPAAPPKQAARDPIADLIRAEDTTASVTPRAKPPQPAKADPPAATDAGVAKAQRALTKLGYGPVKADGAMGPATRAAIEKFERDRKLPVTGVASGRTLRALETGAAKG